MIQLMSFTKYYWHLCVSTMGVFAQGGHGTQDKRGGRVGGSRGMRARLSPVDGQQDRHGRSPVP
jgi:hypothetical protein